MTSALPDVVEEYQKDIVYFYQDLLDFCFKDSIKIHIEENEDAIDEIHYVVEAFFYGFARYLDKNALYRDEYFHLVERTLNSFKDLKKDMPISISSWLVTFFVPIATMYMEFNFIASGTIDKLQACLSIIIVLILVTG